MEGEAPRKRMGKARCPGSPESKVQKERSSGNVWGRQGVPKAPEAKCRKREAPEAYAECRRTYGRRRIGSKRKDLRREKRRKEVKDGI